MIGTSISIASGRANCGSMKAVFCCLKQTQNQEVEVGSQWRGSIGQQRLIPTLSKVIYGAPWLPRLADNPGQPLRVLVNEHRGSSTRLSAGGWHGHGH